MRLYPEALPETEAVKLEGEGALFGCWVLGHRVDTLRVHPTPL